MGTPLPTLSLKSAYAFGIAHGLESAIREIRDMPIEWDLSYNSSLRRGYIVELFQKHGIFEEFKAQHWPAGNTAAGASKTKLYLNIKARYENVLSGSEPEPLVDAIEDEEDQSFAAEADLRDFLAKNPTCIEPGLTLYEKDGRTGVEFAIDNGFTDLLFVDRSNKFVVVELKLGRGRNKAVGQLLYYMAWIDDNLGRGPCRGIIVAKDMTPDVSLAVKRVPGIALFSYKLSVTLQSVH